MSNSSSSSSSSGIGFGGALTILFVALKLTGYIDWSWWWVLSPIWITVAFILLIVFGALGVAVRSDMKAAARRKNRL